MLSMRISELFRLLQCSNTDIARFAGCSPSNISRLRSAKNEPSRNSRTVFRLAEGVYRYADYENMLAVLKTLCEAEDTQAGTMIPAIVGWLFEERDYILPEAVTPKSKRAEENRRHSFGERLDRAMTLLEISNGQMAASLNVDVSLISRYRSGIYYPNRNQVIRDRLSDHLLRRAEKLDRSPELASLCGAETEELSQEVLMEWLFEPAEGPSGGMAETLLRSIETFAPGQGLPTEPPHLPPIREEARYWGTEGLRSAVVRFLADAAREGGELLLYSDEPMDWMSGDRDYFALWASLMVACVRNGVHIRIIHNVDRIGPEMVAAINGWFPLYMSGMIEPYLFRTGRNIRFYHTLFLHSGGAAIHSFYPAEAGETRWYDYITDRKQLEALASGFGAMLSNAAPLLKTFPISRAEAFWQTCRESYPEKWRTILAGPSLPTMPEGLLRRMLDRAGVADGQRDMLLNLYRTRRQQLRDVLAHSSIDEISCLPDAAVPGGVKLNLHAELIDLPICYTPEEYREHILAIRSLVNNEKNYHLTLLPQSPFQDLQVFTLRDAVAVLRCREPLTAFVYMDSTLTRSVTEYCDSLISQYAADRFTTVQALDALITS